MTDDATRPQACPAAPEPPGDGVPVGDALQRAGHVRGQAGRDPSHLDVESPQFAGRPHVWIQWKGTSVCMDVRCDCGAAGHVDAEFAYFIRCAACGTVWEVGTHVALHRPRRVPAGALVIDAE